MFESVKDLIYKLFGRIIKHSKKDIEEAKEQTREYQDTTRENITAIFANSLSTLAFSDSSISITDGNNSTTKRTDLLNNVIQDFWTNIKQNIAIGNGCGMIVSIPYCVNGKLYIDNVSKDRMFVSGMQGKDITKLTVMAAVRHHDNGIKYVRWVDYSVENGVYTIRQKATKNGVPCSLSEIEDWTGILPEMHIANVNRLPVGIYKCPTSSRRPDKIDGVPISFGCQKTIERIHNCLEDIDKEYNNKKAKVFADASLFDKNDKIEKTIFKTFAVDSGLQDKMFFEIFDPAFRDTSYYNRLEHLFAQLEKEIGTSRGILTDLNITNGATATEIRRATFQTFSLCDDIHKNAEKYIDGLVYGLNILANYFNLTPESDYQINYEWSYSMLEDTQNTFNQLIQAKSVGAVETAEIRQFITGEDYETAKAKVEEIKASEPNISDLIGE